MREKLDISVQRDLKHYKYSCCNGYNVFYVNQNPAGYLGPYARYSAIDVHERNYQGQYPREGEGGEGVRLLLQPPQESREGRAGQEEKESLLVTFYKIFKFHS